MQNQFVPKESFKTILTHPKNQRIAVNNNTMKTRYLHFKRFCCCYQLQCYHIVIPGRGVNISTHRGRVTHICVDNLTIIGSVNGLSPGRRQAIIWINAGILFIEPLGINFSEISIGILRFPLTKMRLKVSSAKWRPYCLGFNVLKHCILCHCVNDVCYSVFFFFRKKFAYSSGMITFCNKGWKTFKIMRAY